MTRKQYETLEKIKDLYDEEGVHPSIRRVARELGVSYSAMRERVLGLVRRGWLKPFIGQQSRCVPQICTATLTEDAKEPQNPE